MNQARIDKLIAEFEALGVQAKQIKERRRAIADQFGVGRTEGTLKDFYLPEGNTSSRIDMERLRRYVTKQVLDECRVSKYTAGCGRVVNKLKRRAKKVAS